MSESVQFRQQFGAVMQDGRRRLDLARSQLQLHVDAELTGNSCDVRIEGRRCATIGVGEDEFLLDSDSGHIRVSV